MPEGVLVWLVTALPPVCEGVEEPAAVELVALELVALELVALELVALELVALELLLVELELAELEPVLPLQELWKSLQAFSALLLGHLLFKQLFTLSLSLEQMQLTSFMASHLLEPLVTSATHANKQAGGVASTWLENKATATEERTVEVRITSGFVSLIDKKRLVIDLLYVKE